MEQYHAPSVLAYKDVKDKSGRDTSDVGCLELATFAVTCTTGPEERFRIILVFGPIPRPIRTGPAVSRVERAYLFDKELKQIESEQAKKSRSVLSIKMDPMQRNRLQYFTRFDPGLLWWY